MDDSSAIPGLVVILGSPNDPKGKVSIMGLGRLELGRRTYLALEEKGWRILLTGGWGGHFNTTDRPHAHHARAVLLAAGVPAERIVEFAESSNTREDALDARPIVEKYAARALVVVTSDFHVARAERVFRAVFPDMDLRFLAAPYLATLPAAEREALEDHDRKEMTKAPF